jgi:hypothetical protein
MGQAAIITYVVTMLCSLKKEGAIPGSVVRVIYRVL